MQGGDVGLHGLLHVTIGDQGGRQINVAVDKVGLQADRVPIVLEGERQLATLLVHVAQVAAMQETDQRQLAKECCRRFYCILESLCVYVPVRLGQERILFDGQRGEVRRLVQAATLKVDRGQEQKDAGVGLVLAPQLHAVPFRILVVERLVLAMRQLQQSCRHKGERTEFVLFPKNLM